MSESATDNEAEGMSVSDTRLATNLADAIRAAADVLERLVDDRSLLASVDKADQQRLLHAAGKVWTPDETRRRQLTRALAKQRKAEATKKGEELLEQTGIRTLRRRPTFTTPNIYPASTGRRTAHRRRRGYGPSGASTTALLRVQEPLHGVASFL